MLSEADLPKQELWARLNKINFLDRGYCRLKLKVIGGWTRILD
jgi:hypothetical protein